MKNQAGSIVATGDNYGFIDVLRGVSACLVIVFHAMHVSGRADFPANGIWHFFDYGWVGVNVFLLISGLVITLCVFRYIERYREMSWHLLEKPVSGFFRARVARSHRSCKVQLAAQLP